jgi:formate dehydrogenase subunit gamma
VRVTHWLNAIGFSVLTFTGAVMYGAPGTQWVGSRDVVRDVHLWVGLVLLLPLLYGFAFSPSLRDDVRRLARWTHDDQRWWFPSQRHTARLGKFNPGQKANAGFTFAALLALLGTGAMMKWYGPFGDDWRTGATFVHDWTALVLGLVVIGHIVMALRDRDAFEGMWRGSVRREWAASERPRWFAEMSAEARSEARNNPEAIEEPR